MWKSLQIILVVFLLTISLTVGQNRRCILQDNCEKCLLADPACAWCTDRNYNLKKPRCMTPDELVAASCESVYQNKYEALQILENRPSQDYSMNENGQDAIQIQPQRVKLSVAKGQTQSFKMTYRPARNYPLDLYYLMDLTWTMRDDREMLTRMANKIASKMYSLTENYRIGFGSFADKAAMPFALPGEKYQKNPCAPEHEICGPVYGFRHRLNFTTDMSQFIDKVSSSEITANLDNYEGGLDALMQIMVCGGRIGWKEKTRKIIVFATDSKMHFAGDGKLAGIVRKNDEQCHLDGSGEYAGTLDFDYPSLEQIYRVLTRQKMNVIFAVAGNYVNHYDQVHQLLKEISSVGTLEMDSSNIIQLIEQGYSEFLKRVHFVDNAPNNIKVEYFSNCGGLYATPRAVDRCSNIEIGKSYDFYVNVTVLDQDTAGADGGKLKHQIRIEESSLSEGVDIEVEIRDLCGCLQEEAKETDSPLCSRKGDYSCGMCFCQPGHGGKICECDMMSETTSDKQLEQNCRQPMGNGTLLPPGPVCSEFGTCLCGQCYCYKGRTGPFCECVDCPRYNGLECGGSERAFCDCGECVCKNGWTGSRCDCNPNPDQCYPPNSDKLCSSHGDCKCGACKCDWGFTGAFCESKSGVESALCTFYEPCVKCLISRKANETACPDLSTVCNDRHGREFDYVFKPDLDQELTRCLVRMKVADDKEDVCEHYYTYKVNEFGHSELVIDERTCQPVNMAVLSFLVILLTLLGGVAIFMIIKAYFWYDDRRIMAEFHKQQHMTTYQETSPLYKSPIVHYEVPDEYRLSNVENRESFVVKEAAFDN